MNSAVFQGFREINEGGSVFQSAPCILYPTEEIHSGRSAGASRSFRTGADPRLPAPRHGQFCSFSFVIWLKGSFIDTARNVIEELQNRTRNSSLVCATPSAGADPSRRRGGNGQRWENIPPLRDIQPGERACARQESGKALHVVSQMRHATSHLGGGSFPLFSASTEFHQDAAVAC